MYPSDQERLANAIRQFQQAEQKVVFVQETILSLEEPTLAHAAVLREFLLKAYSEHLGTITLFPDEAYNQEAYDKFEELYNDVEYAVAMKYVAAKRSSAPPTSDAAQIVAEAWLVQQLKAWESRQENTSKQPVECHQTSSRTLEEVAEDYALSTSIHPNPAGSRLSEEPTKNARADTRSDAPDVASSLPQSTTVMIDPVDHQASTGNQEDVASSASPYQLLPAVVPCLGRPDGGSKTETEPVPGQEPKTKTQTRPKVDSALEYDPLVPSAVKAPDKLDQPRSCRVQPDDGALQMRSRRWSRRDTTGQEGPSSLSYLNRGEYVRCPPKEKPHQHVRPCPMTADSRNVTDRKRAPDALSQNSSNRQTGNTRGSKVFCSEK